MTGKASHKSRTGARDAAARLEIDRAAVAIRLGGPSTEPLTPRIQYLAARPLAEGLLVAKAPQSRSAKHARPQPRDGLVPPRSHDS